jgi:hypothetical protein
VRWWDGLGWTEHVALPEPEPEEEEVGYLAVARTERPVLADDGLLHPRSKDVVFAGAIRGSVTPLAERYKVRAESLMTLRGAQAAGAAAMTLLCWWIVLHAAPHGLGAVGGACLVLGVLIPLVTRALLRVQVRLEFWWHWCATRGLEILDPKADARRLPISIARSPLVGASEQRVVELLATRKLANQRTAFVGSLLRTTQPGGEEDPASTVRVDRLSFVVMPIPETAAARWAGASIRADHGAVRPIVQRATVGALLATGVPGALAHVAAAPDQDPRAVVALADGRLEQFLVEHPVDVDIVSDVLVVTRDGAPTEADPIDDLCRTALLLHELLVAEHELPVELEPVQAVAMPSDDEPVIDLTREGWSHDVSAAGEGYAEAA